MRKGLFLSALFATFLFGGTALAERNDDSDNRSSRGRAVKEQVLEKMKEGRGARHESVKEGLSASKNVLKEHSRPRGEIFSDSATRGGAKAATVGRNMSASNKVNTPNEIRAMRKMINPLHGAYRTSEVAEVTDSYGGSDSSRVSTPKGKNMSASGKVNTPKEIAQMVKIVNPMFGAYRTAAAGEDSYGGSRSYVPWAHSTGTTSVHFKNEKGEVIGVAKGDNGAAKRSHETREKINKAISSKIERVKN